MTTLNFIGWALLLIPFVLLFAFLVKEMGYKGAAKLVVGVVAIYVVIWSGIALTGI